MKIYLAAGFSVVNVQGRERELCNKFTSLDFSWHRLQSFYFKELIYKSEIIELVKENQ